MENHSVVGEQSEVWGQTARAGSSGEGCDKTQGCLVPRLLDTQVPLDAEEKLRMELGLTGRVFPA